VGTYQKKWWLVAAVDGFGNSDLEESSFQLWEGGQLEDKIKQQTP